MANKESEFLVHLPELLQQIRSNRGWSRGQVARFLKVSPTIVYNLETGRSRIKWGAFVQLVTAAKFVLAQLLRRHLFSIKSLDSTDGAILVRSFRNRLKLSQGKLARALGYRSSSMIHHFEKGIREPSLADMFCLMQLAGDDVRGLVQELTEDEEFAALFPIGGRVADEDWTEYWNHVYIPLIRQIMRTRTYQQLQRFDWGYFQKVLGVTAKQEKHAIKVLESIGLVRWQSAKPQINNQVQIAMPKDLTKADHDRRKLALLDFVTQQYLQDGDGSSSLLSFDLLPVNAAFYQQIVARIRDLQDELHNQPVSQSDGVVCLGWLAAYSPAQTK